MRQRVTRAAAALLLALAALGGIACDREDRADVKEFGRQVQKGAEQAGKDVENTIDQGVDTDGKDD